MNKEIKNKVMKKKKRKSNKEKDYNNEILLHKSQRHRLRPSYRNLGPRTGNITYDTEGLQKGICFTKIGDKYFDLYPIDDNNK